MRKFMVIGTVLAMFFAGGCAEKSVHFADGYDNETLKNAPEWVFEPVAESDALAEVGTAPPSPGGFQFQKIEAMANARDELARKIGLQVSGTIKTHAEQNDDGSRRRFDKVMANISDQKTDRILKGTFLKDMWIAADGTMFVLVAMDSESVAGVVEDTEPLAVASDKSFWKNDAAGQQKMKSEEGEKE